MALRVISMRSMRSWPQTFGFRIGAAHLDRTQTKDLIRAFYTAFPDYTHTPEETLAIGGQGRPSDNEPRDPQR